MRTRFARGFTNALGKIQPPLGQLRLHQRGDERLREEAARAGKPIMEFARDFLELALVGRHEIEHSGHIYLDRLEALVPKGDISVSQHSGE